MNRKQQDVIDYPHAENEILKEQFDKKGGKLDLSNTERRKLAKRGKKLGRVGLMQFAGETKGRSGSVIKFERLGGL